MGGVVQPGGSAQRDPEPVPRGRVGASGAGRADGGALGPSGGREPHRRPGQDARFDRPVPASGYTWWYVDALSDDGSRGLTIIAFLGSVFSPYYAWARRHAGAAGADPLAHVALNVALYGSDGRRWTMTERSARRLERDARSLRIGPSRLERHGDALTISIDEITAPWPSRVRGTVRVTADHWHDTIYPLDTAGRHEWQPLAPCARVEVELEQPRSRWSGLAYVDSNRGSAPLEHDFSRWHWSRAVDETGRTTVLYDANRRDGTALGLALAYAPQNATAESLTAPAECTLPRSAWGIARATRSDAGTSASVAQTLEDGPFYARSLVRAQIDGRATTAVHESLDLDRFASPWVRAMLPFRMPRRG